jgi:hypothetical protein
MISIEHGQELHQRLCNGDSLSTDEQAELNAWYTKMDADEARYLNVDTPDRSGESEIRAKIQIALDQLAEVTKRTTETEKTNQQLRQQNEELIRVLEMKGVLSR